MPNQILKKEADCKLRKGMRVVHKMSPSTHGKVERIEERPTHVVVYVRVDGVEGRPWVFPPSELEEEP